MAPSKNKPPQSSHLEKICLWTKFQPPTCLLAPPVPVFMFRPLNKLPLQMAPSKNKPRHAVRVQKIDILPEFHPNRPIFQTNLVGKTANGGTLVRSSPHKTPLKKGTSSLRSEVKNTVGCHILGQFDRR